MRCVAFVVAVLTVSVYPASLPASVKLCKHSSPDHNECLARAITGSLGIFANGNKELGLPKVDPLLVPSIHIAGSGGSVDLEQTYTNLNVLGLSKTKVTSAKFDSKDCKFSIEAENDQVDFKSHLKLSGKMLLFTLNGHGRGDITISKLKIILDMPCKREEKDGKTYLNIHDVKLDLKPEKVIFDIENVIDGNQQLSAEVLKVMNENDQDIFRELKKDYENTFAQIFTNMANTIFSKIPEDEIILK